MAFAVTSLPDFKQVNRDQIINKVVLGGRFISRITKQTGVKKDALINLLDTDPQFQNGAVCGFTAKGDTTLSQRTIATGDIKVNMSWCPQTLLGKYAEYQVRIAATPNAEHLPFEEEIIANVESHINKKLETALFFGDTASEDENLKRFDGIVKIANADSGVVKTNIGAGSTAYAAIKQVYLALPEDILDKAEIYVSPALYRQFILELVEKNYYHYPATEDAPSEIKFPGTDVLIVKTEGLATSETKKYIVAGDPREIVFGCDLENDREDARIWFSDDDDLYKMKISFNAGIQYAFSDRIVLADYTTIAA